MRINITSLYVADQQQALTLRQPGRIQPQGVRGQRQPPLFAGLQIQQPDAVRPFTVGLEGEPATIG